MKKFVIVGTGGRSGMYVNALCRDYREENALVALCDTNYSRMEYWKNYIIKEGCPAPAIYHASEFDRMIATEKPDKVIVCSVDRTHHKYICRAMELGCDVISEKPMTVDEKKCQQIIDTKKRTGKVCRCVFI